MVTVTAPAPEPPAPQQGHCSRCGKVWTLAEAQGVCQWCGKSATCQTAKAKPRKVTTRRRPRPPTPTIGNDYEQLPEPYLSFYNVASPFAKSVPTQDQEDLLHTIIANLIDAGNGNSHKPDNPSWMYRIASFTKADYWRAHYKRTAGLDCGHCSKEQKRKCKKDWLYGECPKLVRVESLSKPIIDSEGNLTELGNLIVDDKTLDLHAWLDYKTFMLTSPERLLLIGEKLQDGIPLDSKDKMYLQRFRQREKKRLF